MDPFPWVVFQLMSYSLGNWCLFVAIAVLAGYFGRLPGILAGHVVTAVLIAALDVSWIQSEMAAPGWDGSPDQDFGFLIGVVLRILLINAFLLPVGVMTALIAVHRRKLMEENPASKVSLPG